MRRTLLFLALGLFIGFLLVVGLGLALRPHEFHGTVLQAPDEAPDFTLKAADGQAVKLSQFRNHIVLLYFGYTYCPDVCPATLAEITTAMRILGAQSEQVQVIMISVDPERDTPDKLGPYMRQFDSRFLGLSGSLEEIQRVATLYGIFFEKQPGTEATGYLVDHTASVMLIDKTGHVKVIFPFGTSGEDIADDVAYILR